MPVADYTNAELYRINPNFKVNDLLFLENGDQASWKPYFACMSFVARNCFCKVRASMAVE